MNLSFFLVALFAICAVFSADVDESDVLVLTTDAFDAKIAESEIIMVEFYAPWCGHCKSLIPEYAEAATSLKADNIPLAKVDATVETELATKYGVRGYPTIKIFRKGQSEPKDYQGQRTASAIATYLRKQLLPALTELKTEEDVTKFQEKDKFVVVGFFAEGDEKLATFKTIVDSLRDDFTFGSVGSADVATKFGVTAPAVVVFKTFDENKVVYDGDFTADSIKTFINGESVPLLAEVGPENYQKYMETKLPLGFLFIDPAQDNTKIKEEFTAIAKKLKGKVNICWIDNTKYNSQAGRLGLAGKTVPTFAIDNPVAQTHYAFDEKVTFESAAVAKWLDEFVEGKIEPTVKSEDIPEKNDGPVTVLVGKNFNDIVMDEKKDVLVEFYAPWCGHCKSLAPIYEKLGEFYQTTESVVIAKIDATANDVDPKYGVKGFPTLKFFPANNKKNPLPYDGERTEEALKAFIKANAAISAKGEEGLKEELKRRRRIKRRTPKEKKD